MTEYMQTASVDPIDVVRRHSLTALVRDEIERHIVEGELAPGDKLNEAEWAARLRVSPSTVRNHAASLYSKLDIHTRGEAILWARERGFSGTTERVAKRKPSRKS